MASNVGGVVGLPYYKPSPWSSTKFDGAFDHCFYTALGNGPGGGVIYAAGGEKAEHSGCAVKTTAEMKNLVSELAEGYAADPGSLNNGYPVLNWQIKVNGKYNYDDRG